MSRYKGRAGLKVIESKFPHHIDMLVPEGGFGSRLNAMHERRVLPPPSTLTLPPILLQVSEAPTLTQPGPDVAPGVPRARRCCAPDFGDFLRG